MVRRREKISTRPRLPQKGVHCSVLTDDKRRPCRVLEKCGCRARPSCLSPHKLAQRLQVLYVVEHWVEEKVFGAGLLQFADRFSDAIYTAPYADP